MTVPVCGRCGTTNRYKPAPGRTFGRCRTCHNNDWRTAHPKKTRSLVCRICGGDKRTAPTKHRPYGRCSACYEAAKLRFRTSVTGKVALDAARKKWKVKPGVKARMTVLAREKKYGLTGEQQAAMLEAQGNRCACCGDLLAPGHGTHLDHNHRTGQVRAFVCPRCNHAVGNVDDDPERARKLVAYLEGHAPRLTLAR